MIISWDCVAKRIHEHENIHEVPIQIISFKNETLLTDKKKTLQEIINPRKFHRPSVFIYDHSIFVLSNVSCALTLC